MKKIIILNALVIFSIFADEAPAPEVVDGKVKIGINGVSYELPVFEKVTSVKLNQEKQTIVSYGFLTQNKSESQKSLQAIQKLYEGKEIFGLKIPAFKDVTKISYPKEHVFHDQIKPGRIERLVANHCKKNEPSASVSVRWQVYGAPESHVGGQYSISVTIINDCWTPELTTED
jgi:hypothetical protein